ncbi:peptidoglycan hydrolase-like protein with peptidoglycan-binding domain [Hamadaea flava]|uniref:Penicillin-insensitive murein endopeptidase n=1 Tax=Hamadaea flava TaxID=1742688 RepID=A0ABV8LQF4_9ACTN|nr:penicillin-insensitive murein endopeptidase [Hamadaea flava]MCP2322837.1 peptidoglycan hydrolase-like protein with peptidoglycan-binding domain [Hamadaea flava]
MRRFLLLLTALVAAVPAALTAAAPAQAYAGAFFPTQSSGNRGADVLAIQHLLAYHGQATTLTGVFDSATVTKVKAFQAAKGLGVDGIVGPATWGALVVQIGQGTTSDAVKALQVELNAKRNLSLTVSGSFDAATDSAVRTFQSHAGIGVDGIAGPITWKNLVWHYDYPAFTNLCDQDPDGNGTAANWATAAAIGQVEKAAADFAATGQGKLPLGDAGFEHGGDIAGHASHEVGLDVDVWPIRADDAQCTAGRITWQSSTYDRAATRQLVQMIRAAAPGHIMAIWFNDPTLISEGLTSAYEGHDNHIHIRYCEKIHPNSLYDC